MWRGSIKRVTVMIPLDIHKELKLHAVSNDTTLQGCILQAIKDHLQNVCKTVNREDPSTPEDTTVKL